MKRVSASIRNLLVLFLVFGVWGCAFPKASTGVVPHSYSQPVPDEKGGFPRFELPIPQTDGEKIYLGVFGTGSFTLSQVKSRVVLIEVFNFYCPHCQHAAPKVNELYQAIVSRSDVREKIKIIGIGIGNTSYEVNSFKEKYQVPFPLFPDQSGAISNMLGVKGTPTFIGVKVDENGSLEQFYFKSGGFSDAEEFLGEVTKLAGIA